MTTQPDTKALPDRGDPDRRPSSPEDVLPAVKPPSAGFLLQLFLIPMLIVSVIVLVWLLFSWMASAGSQPHELVRDLKKLNNSSWQKASSLADLLRDPKYDELKDDPKLAQELAEVLEAELKLASVDPVRLKLRIYLCRMLGEFRVADVVPTLLEAANQQKSPEEIHVRAAAIEALALVINTQGAEKLRDSQPLQEALIEASTVTPKGDDPEGLYPEVRSRAAFALGILGGDAANRRLEQMLHDGYPNARYNAATGLARQGDAQCATVLLEMLDPQGADAIKGETKASNQEAKRLSVLVNGMRAAELLAERVPDAKSPELTTLREAIEKLTTAKISHAVNLVAKETLSRIDAVTASRSKNAGAKAESKGEPEAAVPAETK